MVISRSSSTYGERCICIQTEIKTKMLEVELQKEKNSEKKYYTYKETMPVRGMHSLTRHWTEVSGQLANLAAKIRGKESPVSM